MEARRFALQPTKGAMRRKGEFVCQLQHSPSNRRAFRWSRLVVLVHDVGSGRQLVTVARRRFADDIGSDVARVDQTLRKAIGIADDGRGAFVTLFPLHRPLRLRAIDGAARLVGAQYIHFRVYRAAILDAEKPVCRVGPEAFALLGCQEGDFVVCEAPQRDARGRWALRRIRLRVLSTEWRPVVSATRSERTASDAPDNENRLNATARQMVNAPVVRTSGDLRAVRLDGQARDLLGLQVLDAVRMRRDVRGRVLDGVRDFGIAFLLSLSGAIPLATQEGLPAAAAYGAVAILAAAYVFWKLRSEAP